MTRFCEQVRIAVFILGLLSKSHRFNMKLIPPFVLWRLNLEISNPVSKRDIPSLQHKGWACQFIEDIYVATPGQFHQFIETASCLGASQFFGEAPMASHGQVDKSKAFTELPSALDSIRASEELDLSLVRHLAFTC